jgi:hypothetical protein
VRLTGTVELRTTMRRQAISAASIGNAFTISIKDAPLFAQDGCCVTVSSAYDLASPPHWPRCGLKAAMKLNNSLPLTSTATRVDRLGVDVVQRDTTTGDEYGSHHTRFSSPPPWR